MRGGLLLETRDSIYAENSIVLLGKKEIPHRYQEMFDYRFIMDCIYENMILPRMLDYRVTTKNHSYKSYDPLDILHGYKKWSDLETITQGEAVSDIEDSDEVESLALLRRSPSRSYKMYSRKNQEEIVKYLVRFAAYKLVKGNFIWQKFESLKICKGERSWQSMKEHFRKKIIYEIHTFGLSWRQVRRFRDTFGLDQEHESDADSDEEEGEDNERQRSPIFSNSKSQNSISKKGFHPRRTSSPSLLPNKSSLGSSTAAALFEKGDMDNNDSGHQATEGSELAPKQTRNQTNLNLEEEDRTEETRPAKRKRKLFSTNYSFLEENEPGNQNLKLTAFKKRKTFRTIFEEEESEVVPEVFAITSKIPSTNFGSGELMNSTGNCDSNIIEPKSLEKTYKTAQTIDHPILPSSGQEGERSFVTETSSIQNKPQCDNSSTPDEVTGDKGDDESTDRGSNHMETLEEIFGPDVSPLPIPPARRKSRMNQQNKAITLNDNATSSAEADISQSLGTISAKSQSASPISVPITPTSLSRQSSERPSRSPSPRKRDGRTLALVLNTPTSVCCRKVNTVDVEAIEALGTPGKLIGVRRKSGIINEAEASTSERNQEKENVDKDWYKIKYRTAFSRGEDEAIVKYFQAGVDIFQNNCYK